MSFKDAVSSHLGKSQPGAVAAQDHVESMIRFVEHQTAQMRSPDGTTEAYVVSAEDWRQMRAFLRTLHPPTTEETDSSGSPETIEQPVGQYAVGDFVRVLLNARWLPGLLVSVSPDERTFSVSVPGHEGLLAYGNPGHIPAAAHFLRHACRV